MTEPKNGRPIFFPEKLVVFGNLALLVWIILDTAAFLLFDIAAGIVFLVATLILVYGLLHLLGCLRPCYNCIKCTHGMGRLAALYFGKRIFKDYKYNYKLPTAIFFTIYIGGFPAAFALYSAIVDFTVIKTAVFVALLVFTVYSALTWRPKKNKRGSSLGEFNVIKFLLPARLLGISAFALVSRVVNRNKACGNLPSEGYA